MLYAEDLHEGQTFQFGTYILSEAEILNFARQYDPVSIHADPVAAAAGPFSGLIASGFNTVAIYQRLVVEAVWNKVAGLVGRGCDVRFARPVRPGAALTGHARVQSVTLRPEKQNAVVVLKSELIDDAREPVLIITLDALVRMRPV
ncbi:MULTISPECIES: MaoC/PaaZ C-terminal domain-containing protein [unclassified Beijerinckia]|uniref:MaoC/PaaZ C-terminal domain-containing protein n=1 Tax=unclassified Beijerinckia TaxID=2638183 RepID=UPI000895CE40|nr:MULTISPECIES: MaoC/PaaZ C-terminal domain-containing protein [unclassified Beijerinckia]MDH7799972.1 acyl dehydratase [Beijerinckia sp. GAS462]SED44471.1 Acyl dehydratase [Beijerinckia sp. 28-YEA-48]